MLHYANWGLAYRTNLTYSSGEKRFIRFCLRHRLVLDSGDILLALRVLSFTSPPNWLGQFVTVPSKYIWLLCATSTFQVATVTPWRANSCLRKSYAVSCAIRGSARPFVNRLPPGSCSPSALSFKSGWVQRTIPWFGRRSPLPFLASCVAANLLTRGFLSLVPASTYAPSVCHFTRVLLPHSI